MLAVIAAMKVKEDKVSEFEEIFRNLINEVLEKEPDVLVYELTKSRKEERLYKIVEFYRDQAAFDAHCATSYFQSQFAKLAAMLERPPEGDFLDAVDAWKVPARA